MTISQLIAQLSDIMAQNGDLNVKIGYTVCDDEEENNGYASIRYVHVNSLINNSHVVLGTDIIVNDDEEDY